MLLQKIDKLILHVVGKVVFHDFGGIFAMELGEHDLEVLEGHGEETEVVLAGEGLCVQRDELAQRA